MWVAQRYGCPAMGDVVEGRKSTMESVEEHRGEREACNWHGGQSAVIFDA